MGDSAEKKAKKPGFFKGVKSEFKKITWPDKTRERRIRHRSPLPDAALTPYPAYG